MGLFAIKYSHDDKDKIEQFVEKTNKKLTDGNMFGYGKLHIVDNAFVVIDLKTMWINPAWIGGIVLIPMLYFNSFQFTWWYSISLIFFAMSFFFSKYFQFYVIKKALTKKYGLTGKIYMASNEDVLRWLL